MGAAERTVCYGLPGDFLSVSGGAKEAMGPSAIRQGVREKERARSRARERARVAAGWLPWLDVVISVVSLSLSLSLLH